MKQMIFTIYFGLLSFMLIAGGKKTLYYVGQWDGKEIQINNPNRVGKNKFCIQKIYFNGKKIKTNYKIGGIAIHPKNYQINQGDSMLVTIITRSDCKPSFHSKGFHEQQ